MPLCGDLIAKGKNLGPWEKARSELFSLNSHYRQREAKAQFVLQINLDVVHPELLELDPAEVMNIGGVSFHFLELEFHFGLGQHILFVRAHDARSLLELARAAAPARPNAQSHIIDRQ